MHYHHIQVPDNGEAIRANTDHTLVVPDFPIVPYIEGDGIGIDVTPVMLDVANAAVKRAYGDQRAIRWMQVYAGQAAAEVVEGIQLRLGGRPSIIPQVVEPGVELVDLTPFLVRDVHDVAGRLDRAGQGTFKLDDERSLLDLDEALHRLEGRNGRWFVIVMHRYFGGRTIAETAPETVWVTHGYAHELVRWLTDIHIVFPTTRLPITTARKLTIQTIASMLILGRIAQALFASVPSVVVLLFIRALYAEEGAVKVMSLYGMAVGVASADAGPSC